MPIDFRSDRPGQGGWVDLKINEKTFGDLVKSFYLYIIIKI
jgi:hypothetical protein